MSEGWKFYLVILLIVAAVIITAQVLVSNASGYSISYCDMGVIDPRDYNTAEPISCHYYVVLEDGLTMYDKTL